MMKILYLIELTLLTHHLCGKKTLAFPPDIFESRDSYTFDECDTKLDFSDTGMKKISLNFISSGLCLKSLSLQNNSIEKIEKGTFDNLTDLEYLDLSYNSLSLETLSSFGSKTSLKTLIFDGNHKNGESSFVDTEVTFPELTHLSLGNMDMDSVTINLSRYFPKLSDLDISNNPLTTVDDFLKNLPSSVKSLTMVSMKFNKLKIQNLKEVTSLKLDWNQFYSIRKGSSCDEESLCLENLNELQSLSVRHCDVKQIEPDAFKDLTKLEHLDIDYNGIHRISDETFKYSPLLSSLDISGNPLLNVYFIQNLKNLERLVMNYMIYGIKILWSITSMPKIQYLSLKGNKISSIPMEFLTTLEDLREINLSKNQISSLSPGSWQKKLKSIILYRNNISNVEDLHLGDAKSLQLLDIRENGLFRIDTKFTNDLPKSLDLKFDTY
ncbi:hypothetical protein QAD02_006228 [Eretmocerus hayati]|uniref:Uncharacterized protein n=1 Tax=Eretmocerus hayati TaxID=131215 RepID=A0ACC2N0P0_9HYME|nr:hypothetical protein QAD02_006228 [Eretmocerus hayati]